MTAATAPAAGDVAAADRAFARQLDLLGERCVAFEGEMRAGFVVVREVGPETVIDRLLYCGSGWTVAAPA